MHRPIAALMLLAVSLAAAAEDKGTTFVGAIQRDDVTVLDFSITVPAGKSASIVAEDGTRIELSAASAVVAGPKSVVRLLDASGKSLHEATMPGASSGPKRFSYRICKGAATYASPPASNASSCKS